MSGENTQEANLFIPTLRVLVVDDSSDAAESMVGMLKVFGHDAQAVRHAVAVDMARIFLPHVFLIDPAIPKRSWLSLAGEIQRQREQRNARLVAISAQPGRAA